MADDLDDLLNEVEDQFLRKQTGSQLKTNAQPSSIRQNTTSSVTPSSRKQPKDDLNDMIDDIFDDDENPNKQLKSQSSSNNAFSSQSSQQRIRLDSTGTGRKCFPVFIGGTTASRGISSTINNRACDNLRCTDCDFHVSTFSDYSWHDSTDYLFLRNNMPDFDRLQPKLVRKKGFCAYACQCKSRSTKDLKDLQADYELKWVCGKH